MNNTYLTSHRWLTAAFIGWVLLLMTAPATHANGLLATHVAVTVPFTAPQEDRFYRPHQLVTVELKKDPLATALQGTFMFDTGSNCSCISATVARKLGGGQFLAQGISGLKSPLLEKPVWLQVPRVQVGGLIIEDVPLRVFPDEMLRVGPSHRIDGILGSDFCRSLVVHLDFARGQITFIVPSQTLLYSALDSAPVMLSPEEIAGQGFARAQVVSLIHFNGFSWASTRLRGQRQVADALLLIDSGSDTTMLSEQAAWQLKLAPVSSQNYAEPLAAVSNGDYADVTGAYIASTGWLPSLQSDGLKIDDLLVLWPSSPRVDFNARLGLDVLANYDILLDFPHRKMYLKLRTDLQAVTSHQYEAASAVQRRQWALGRPIITYPTNNSLDSFAIPYELNGSGLPITQVRPNPEAPSVPFLLKTNLTDSYITEMLAADWGLSSKPGMTTGGTPLTFEGKTLPMVTVPHLRVGGAQGSFPFAVLSAALSLRAASGLPIEGVLGANSILSGPLLMDPHTQAWMFFAPNLPMGPDDLKSVEMDDAATLDLLTPNGNGVPACVVQVKQGGQQQSETLILATGSPFTLLSTATARALKLTPEPQKLKYSAGTDVATFNQARVSQLAFGNVILRDVLVVYPDGAMSDSFSPRLGMDVISRLRLLVDTPAKKLYAKKAEN